MDVAGWASKALHRHGRTLALYMWAWMAVIQIVQVAVLMQWQPRLREFLSFELACVVVDRAWCTTTTSHWNATATDFQGHEDESCLAITKHSHTKVVCTISI
ncbi:hypothetical protein H310_08052 [Aphanomyces invadans]|uniref:Uncharacterized protein n=1 Tax=Aphanomyces invadans TaxID=157072 RepID=A0A024TZ87_9STRA|nr:hypothetical protein H310_08052 [Aphanomyces invadans]ETV99323.1 hypothetical protein H310_08052 [Aphanomyces invadans]|eukprot:XP_008871879.1 hypothetical protein H310_08052 [Aphanomyces invadans]